MGHEGGGATGVSIMGILDLITTLLQGRPAKVAVTTVRSDAAFMPAGIAAESAGVVLIADFDGADGERATTALAELLSSRPGLIVRRQNQRLRLAAPGSLTDKIAAAAAEGVGWRDAGGANLLVWGEAEAEVLRVRFLSAASEAGGGGFGLGDVLEVPLTLPGDVANLVHAVILAAALPARLSARARPRQLLQQSLAPLRRLIPGPDPGTGPSVHLSPTQAASALICLGNTFTLASQGGDGGDGLKAALACYRGAVARVPREGEALTWALAENHLAATLEVVAEVDREASLVHLREAADAYRLVAETLTRTTHPNEWALAQARLGAVLHRIAARGGGTTELKAATGAFEAALVVYTRAAMPARWAEIMNQLGVVLMNLGEQVGADPILGQAVTTFRKALEVRRRDSQPLLWAQTANNLGAACFALAKRSGDAQNLHEAAACFEGAIEVYRRHDRPQPVAVLEKNLNRVQRLIEIRRTGQPSSG